MFTAPGGSGHANTMEGITLIQDLAVVLLAAGIAGALCKRVGLSVIVGYLFAGLLIGPHTPPFSLVGDVERIQTLSQVGLVFLMFGIGLGLSLTKLGRMGLPTLIATGLGAFFVLNLTQALGLFAGWSSLEGLFVASMFMVSSSAVIAKIVGELKLSHEGAAQRALGVTVMEDVVAVVMLTVLAGQTQAAGQTAGVGQLLATMSAFVTLLVGGGLLLVPRLFRRLEARAADPELQTILVAGVLFLLAMLAVKAGYSLALGAFLLGAIVAEMPQRAGVEKAFGGMRDLFSSVFFASIGMMIEVHLLRDAWAWILGLFVFVMVGRFLCCGLALTLTGSAPRDARRASLLLTPLGEFSFIIAQLGVASMVLPPEFYAIAVGVSILTVLATPLVNKHADAILNAVDRVEPAWAVRAVEAYHGWLRQVQGGRASPMIWKMVRGRTIQILVEALLVTGLMLYGAPLVAASADFAGASGLDPALVRYGLVGAVGLLVLVLLFAIWRNISTLAMVFADSAGSGGRLSPGVIDKSVRALALVAIGYWLYVIVPIDALPPWTWVIIAGLGLVVVMVFSRRLIYWHSEWQVSVQSVLAAKASPEEARAEARTALDQGLESWGMRLDECVVPDAASYAGQDLAKLAIPARFSCSVIEVERNGHIITATGPDLRVYPGDKLLLLGQPADLAAARTVLQDDSGASPTEGEGIGGSVMETATMVPGPRAGRSLAELRVARATGARIVGIEREGRRIINPDGRETLEAGDRLLLVGTLRELRAFRRWLAHAETQHAPGAATGTD